ICGDFEQWAPIAMGAPSACLDCGRDVIQVLTPPALYAVGERGAITRDNDRRDKTLRADLDAYKRLRRQGLQPQRIDGAHQMETTAQSSMEINSGGIVHGPEMQIRESIELARDITGGLV